MNLYRVRHLFSLLMFIIFSFLIPAHSHAKDPNKEISKLKFYFVGTHFGNNPSLEFSVVTPLNEIITNSIDSDQVFDNIKSTIKIKHIELGKYTITIKNTSDVPVSIIGGIAAISKRRFHKKHDVQTMNAMHVDLNPGNEIKHVYDISTGFEFEDQQPHLLEWNPFDWL